MDRSVNADRLVDKLRPPTYVPQKGPIEIATAKVAVVAVPVVTINFTQDQATDVDSRYLDSYAPTVGDDVFVLILPGGGFIVLGKLA